MDLGGGTNKSIAPAVRLTVSDYLRAPLSCFLELSREAWYGVCLAKFSSTVQDVDGVY